MKIYTRTGDQGETSLYGGTRISKADQRMEAIGTVDELNAHVGLLRDQIGNKINQESFQQIQENLFVIGAMLASESSTQSKIPLLPSNSVESLEQEMDSMDTSLPEMKFFILPGGHPVVSQTHIARCVCRRAERSVVRLSDDPSYPQIIKYLNRLSDYLFVLARYLGKAFKVDEIPWKPSN